MNLAQRDTLGVGKVQFGWKLVYIDENIKKVGAGASGGPYH